MEYVVKLLGNNTIVGGTMCISPLKWIKPMCGWVTPSSFCTENTEVHFRIALTAKL